MKKICNIKIPHIYIFLVFAILSYAYGVVQFKDNSIINNFDTSFQLKRVVGLSNVFSSPINFDTFTQPINIYYGWLTLYPAYIFYAITDNLVTAYNLFLYVLTLATFILAYWSMYSLYKQKFISIIFSLLYTFSMYRTLGIFYRGAMGEVIAIAIYPLVFSAVYAIIVQKKKCWVKLGFAFSLLFYTHVLSAFLAFFFICIIYLSVLFSKLDNKKAITITFLKAGLSAFILSLAFLIPLLEQTCYQKINTPVEFTLSKRALTLKEIIFGSLNEDLSSNTIGLVLFLLTILSALLLIWFKPQYKYIFILGVLTLLCTSKIFPWKLFQNTPINMIQFPYRLTGISTLFLCFTSSYLISSFAKSNMSKLIIMYMLMFICVSLNIYSIANSPFIDRRIDEKNIESELNNAFNNDYKPFGYQKFDDLTMYRLMRVADNNVSVKKVKNANSYDVVVEANDKDIIILPLYMYKGVHVLNNGKESQLVESKQPMIAIEANQGKNNIKVYYSYTTLAKLSFVISLFWLVVIVICTMKIKYKQFIHPL